MSEATNSDPQSKLEEVSQTTFELVKMLPCENKERLRENANKELLKTFIAPRKIEGCLKNIALLSIVHLYLFSSLDIHCRASINAYLSNENSDIASDKSQK